MPVSTPPHILTPSSFTIVLEGKPYTVASSSTGFAPAVAAFKRGDFAAIPGILDIAAGIRAFAGSSGVTVSSGQVYYNGEALHNVLVDRILAMRDQGFSIDPLVAFLGNLMQNPSKHSVDQLYGFLEASSLPITEDGCFLAYKRVGGDYYDQHSHTVRYQIGDVPTMPRNKVDDNPEQTCSHGLHACSLSYLSSFGGARTMVVKINPADVVSVPNDYNNAKLRACRMTVVGEIEGAVEEAFDGSAVDQDWNTEYDEAYDNVF